MKKLNTVQKLSPYGGVTTPSLNTLAPPIPIYAEHGVRHACLSVSPMEQHMRAVKAVLEFTYPQDETKLKHALKGEDYYLALVHIDRMLSSGQVDRNCDEAVHRVRILLDEVLAE